MSVDGAVDEQSVYTTDELLVSSKGDPSAKGLAFDRLPWLLLQTVLSNFTCDLFSAGTEGANFL